MTSYLFCIHSCIRKKVTGKKEPRASLAFQAVIWWWIYWSCLSSVVWGRTESESREEVGWGVLCRSTGGLPMWEKVHKLSNNPGNESLRTKVAWPAERSEATWQNTSEDSFSMIKRKFPPRKHILVWGSLETPSFRVIVIGYLALRNRAGPESQEPAHFHYWW